MTRAPLARTSALMGESAVTMPRVITLGCRLNAAESDVLQANAAASGLGDTIIVNTCAVTNEAVRQARQAIRKAKRDNPGAAVIVTGCAAQTAPEVFAAMPEVSRVLGNSEKLDPAAMRSTERVSVSDIFAAPPRAFAAEPFQPRARAYLQVQNGCDHRCTFCIIPFGRGPAQSAPLADVLMRARRILEAGAQEIVLTGVDLTSWGKDLEGAPSLGDLAAELLRAEPGLPRLRLSSLDAIEVDEKLFEVIAHEPRLAPHLHLSLQHGADMILKRMKRRHSRADAIELCARLKAARPEIAFGADLIAGFPTETEAHFDDLLSLIDAAGLAFVHVFPFSPREGAPAARMPQLDRALVKSRAARLRVKAAEALSRHLQAWVGATAPALVERPGWARLADFTPVRCPPNLRPGATLSFRFTGHDGHALEGLTS